MVGERASICPPSRSLFGVGRGIRVRASLLTGPFVEQAFKHRRFFKRLHHFVLTSLDLGRYRGRARRHRHGAGTHDDLADVAGEACLWHAADTHSQTSVTNELAAAISMRTFRGELDLGLSCRDDGGGHCRRTPAALG